MPLWYKYQNPNANTNCLQVGIIFISMLTSYLSLTFSMYYIIKNKAPMFGGLIFLCSTGFITVLQIFVCQ